MILQPPIFVAGSGRSGTTWIGDSVAAAAGACSIFEPLAPWALKSPAPPCLLGTEPLHAPGLYLPPENEWPEWREFWSSVLNARNTSTWTRQDWRYVPAAFKRWKLTSRAAYTAAAACYYLRARRVNRFLVKAIYSNLSLSWLERRVNMQVLFVTRHPCAVVASRLRLGWPHDLEGIYRQPLLMEQWLEPHRTTLRGLSTPLERMAALWCVENLVPLGSWRSHWRHVSYEELTANPSVEIGRLCRSLGLPRLQAAERTAVQLCSTPGPDAGKAQPWHASLSPADGDTVLRICNRFGLDFYGRDVRLVRSPIPEGTSRNESPRRLASHVEDRRAQESSVLRTPGVR